MDGRAALTGTASLVVKALDFRVEGTGFEPRGGRYLCRISWMLLYWCPPGNIDVHQEGMMSTRKEWCPPGNKHQWDDEMNDSKVYCSTLALIWHVSMHFEIILRFWHKAMRYAIPASMPATRWPPLLIPPRLSPLRDRSMALPEAYVSCQVHLLFENVQNLA